MPEGHSIRRLADQWAEHVGSTFTLSSPQGRLVSETALLSPSRLVATDAHGKHLFLQFERQRYFHIHLGLYGRFTWHSKLVEPKNTVRLRLASENIVGDLSGPTRCDLVGPEEKASLHARLGPDPLRPDSDLKALKAWAAKSAWPIGKTLMEQSKMAGIGNVYRAELLFMLALNPWAPTNSLSEDKWDELYGLARILLQEGVRSGRIVTMGPALPPAATLPPNTHCASRSYVYKRAGLPCLACSTPILSEEFYSRTLYWCPTCQAPSPVLAEK